MGPQAARELANRLNLTRPRGKIILYGSAGALDPQLQVGESFLIHELRLKDSELKLSLNIPHSLRFLPQASCLTTDEPVLRSQDKQSLFEQFQLQIVDCEMAAFMDSLVEDMHSQIIFVRTVIDSSQHSLRFLEGSQIRWPSLVKPTALFDFLRISKNFLIYHRSMSEFLERVYQLSVTTSTEPEASQL